MSAWGDSRFHSQSTMSEASVARFVAKRCQAYQFQFNFINDTTIGRITLYQRKMNSVFCAWKLLRTRDSQGSGSFNSGSRRRSLLDEAAQDLTKFSFCLWKSYFIQFSWFFKSRCCSLHHGPQLKLRSSTAQPAFLRPTCHGKDRVAKSLNPLEQTTETCKRLITQLHSISWSKEVPLRRSWIHSCTHPSSIAAGSTLAPLKSFSRISIQTFWWIVDTYGTYRIRILQNSKMQDIPQWCFFMFFRWVLELHCYCQTKGIQCCDTVQVPGHYWWSCIFPLKFSFKSFPFHIFVSTTVSVSILRWWRAAADRHVPRSHLQNLRSYEFRKYH